MQLLTLNENLVKGFTMKNERDTKKGTKADKKQKEKSKQKPTSRSNGKKGH